RRHANLMDALEPNTRPTCTVSVVDPRLLNQRDHTVVEPPPLSPRRIPRQHPLPPGLRPTIPPNPHGLAIQAKMAAGWFDAIVFGVHHDGQPLFHSGPGRRRITSGRPN